MSIQPDVDSRVEQLTRGTDLGWIASVLYGQRDAILKGWLDAAVKQPFHESRPERAVADHIPACLKPWSRYFDGLRRGGSTSRQR